MSNEGQPLGRRSSAPLRAALPWLVGGLLVLVAAVLAGLLTAYLVATLRAVPPPQSLVTPAPSPRPIATSTPRPTEAAPSPSPTPRAELTPDPSPAPEATPLVHVVARGESISIIAARYGVTADAIIALNELRNPNLIVPGQRLLIPLPAATP